MDPQGVFCPNTACPARGQVGGGNIRIHSQKERRYRCGVCQQTFAESKETPFYRLHHQPEVLVTVTTLLAHGCPIQAIVAAFGLDERTVVRWQRRAGQHCEQVHQQLVEQPRELGQVQADEIRVKLQGVVVWLATAIQVSTRLWLGGSISPQRDTQLLVCLMRQVRACALCRPMLVCVDGFSAYLEAIRRTFRTAVHSGQPGRPRLRPWDDVSIAQVVKHRVRQRVVGVERRVVQGSHAQIQALLAHTQGGGQLNVAYIERLNATFRARIAALVRRSRALARQPDTVYYAMYLMGTVYNFCTYHDSLRVPLALPGNRRRWLARTPAIAAGLTDHRWTVAELLSFHVPLPAWTPPKRRGRMSQATKALVKQWAS